MSQRSVGSKPSSATLQWLHPGKPPAPVPPTPLPLPTRAAHAAAADPRAADPRAPAPGAADSTASLTCAADARATDAAGTGTATTGAADARAADTLARTASACARPAWTCSTAAGGTAGGQGLVGAARQEGCRGHHRERDALVARSLLHRDLRVSSVCKQSCSRPPRAERRRRQGPSASGAQDQNAGRENAGREAPGCPHETRGLEVPPRDRLVSCGLRDRAHFLATVFGPAAVFGAFLLRPRTLS